MASASTTPQPGLRRVVGIPGAVLMGLGSILGTGIFVSIGIAAGIVGPGVVVAVFFAAILATFNGLSSAQLAANHPVSGGTYEYGYRYLGPWLGFTAGWMFLCAKAASAATATLGLAGYLLHLFDRSDAQLRMLLGLVALTISTLVVAGGIRRSNRANATMVTITVVALGAFAIAGGARVLGRSAFTLSDVLPLDLRNTAHATALMFVAYTGYGRIATLGEEIRDPRRSIPRAIVMTLAVSMVLYVAVALVASAAVGARTLAALTRDTAAPLHAISQGFGFGWLPPLLAVGAVTAMTGVVFNLLLGISRVVLAMARRGDLPRFLATVREREGSPVRAVIFTGILVAVLVVVGDIRVAWTFSAFTILVYYGLTNLAALRLSADERLFPRIVPALGLVSCFGVATFVDRYVWMAGVGVLGIGLLGRLVARRS